MKLQTMFEPVTIWEFGPFVVVRKKEQQKLVKRLYSAEAGFDYAHRIILPKIQQQRDQQMLNAHKYRDELKAAKAPPADVAAMREALDEAFDFLGGLNGASEIRHRILTALAAGTGTDETTQLAPGEAPQSGGDSRNAQETPHEQPN